MDALVERYSRPQPLVFDDENEDDYAPQHGLLQPINFSMPPIATVSYHSVFTRDNNMLTVHSPPLGMPHQPQNEDIELT